MRISIMAAIACLSITTLSAAEYAAAAARQETKIPAQSLGSALEQFASDRNLQLVYATSEVDRLQSSGASGNLSAAETLSQLLQGTGLSYQFLDEKTVTVQPIVVSPSTPSPANAGTSSSRGATETADMAKKGLWDRFRLTRANPFSDDSTTNVDSSRAGPQQSDALKNPSDEKLEEIVVTAQKREERVIDVPMSVTAISGDQLNASGINNVLDLSLTVPGLAVTETGPGRQIVAIRGIASIRGSSSLTGVYLDEMPITGVQDGFIQSAYADLRTIDLARVEILKGPQGTLFGEGAAGGVIRFVTNDPDLNRVGGSVATEFFNTSDGGWSEGVTGILNLPLATDVFGIRVAASYEDRSGWIDRPSTGEEDINDSEMAHVRLKALYTPTRNLQIKGLAEIHRNDIGATNIVNQKPFKSGNFLQAIDLVAGNRYGSTQSTDDYEMFNLTVAYDFGFAELLSSTSYAKLDSSQSFTQMLGEEPTPWLEIFMPALQQHSLIKSQEFRLTSSSEGPFDWVVGAIYKDAELTGGFGSRGFDASVLGGGLQLVGLGAGSMGTGFAESWAGFADGSYNLTARLEVGGGLRYYSDKRGSFDKAVPLSLREVLTTSFNKTTFRSFIKYAITEQANVYFNVGTGARSGAPISAFAVSRGAPESYGPENTLFYEIGTKLSLFGGRVRVDGAVFYGEYEDMFADKVTISPIDGNILQYTANGQSSEVKGVEWDIGWAATDNLTLTLTGGVTDTEIVEVEAAEPTPVYFLGDPISLVPEYNVSVSADYRFQWSESVPGFLMLSFDRKGKSYWTERTNALQLEEQYVAPEVSFLNASIGAEWNGWKWGVVGRNLLDERKPISASLSGWTSQARPRTVGLTVSKRF